MDFGSQLTSPRRKPVKIHKGNPGAPTKSGRQMPDVGQGDGEGDQAWDRHGCTVEGLGGVFYLER